MPMDALSRYRHEPPQRAADRHGVVRAAVPARWGDGGESAAADGTVVFHTAVAGDTFETLAVRFLGSSALWWRIADLNPTAFPLAIEPGTVVALPGNASVAGPVRTRTW